MNDVNSNVNTLVPYCSFINYAMKYDLEYIKEVEVLRREIPHVEKIVVESQPETPKRLLPNEIMNNIILYCSADILISISQISNSWNTIIKSNELDFVWNLNCIRDYNTSFSTFRESSKNDKPVYIASARELYIHLTTSFKRLKREWFGSITKPNLVIPNNMI